MKRTKTLLCFSSGDKCSYDSYEMSVKGKMQYEQLLDYFKWNRRVGTWHSDENDIWDAQILYLHVGVRVSAWFLISACSNTDLRGNM